MKTLLLMRHGKSSWKDETLSDHERPLKKRGQKDAKRIAMEMINHDLIPELILSSTAVRAKETVKAILSVLDEKIPVEFSRELYMAEPEDFVEILSDLSNDLNVVMLVGHNPGMEAYLQIIDGNIEAMPTASLGQLSLKVVDWKALSMETEGELIGFWTPKALEATNH
jgi:phosphohistidine phosphatase